MESEADDFSLWEVIVKHRRQLDLLRDRHDDHVTAVLAELVNEATPLTELVRLALNATAELAF
jgi:hypothetical protein